MPYVKFLIERRSSRLGGLGQKMKRGLYTRLLFTERVEPTAQVRTSCLGQWIDQIGSTRSTRTPYVNQAGCRGGLC